MADKFKHLDSDKKVKFRLNLVGTENLKWVLTVTLMSFLISAVLSVISSTALERLHSTIAFFLLFFIILINVIFDIIGIAVTSADETPFNAIASRKYFGARQSIMLIRNANKVSSVCNDVVGDIGGVISGTASALIALSITAGKSALVTSGITVLVTGLVAALTIGGKALGKTIAIQNSNYIVYKVGKIIAVTGYGKRDKKNTKGRTKKMSTEKERFKFLNNLYSPEYVKSLNIEQLNLLASEIREFVVECLSKTGGHLASNLGVVELTLALHRVFDTPLDKIIWDVGHQSYIHKIITGRKDSFDTLRQMGGISGFPRVKESPHDIFDTGHSSTSISAALGMARARDIKNEKYSVVAVIGDGALTGGMAFEALNDAGRSLTNFIVILNDNEMSISKNVGGMSRHLSNIRSGPYYYKFKEDVDFIFNKFPVVGKKTKRILHKVKSAIKYNFLPGVIFEELGFKYLGPIDGHDLDSLTDVLSKAKKLKGPIFIHVCTQKGRGYSFAEEKPHIFHGISPFEVETGEVLSKSGTTFSKVFGEKLLEIGENNPKVVAITAAMPNATGLEPFSKKFPTRFFDVGIAEQHAVTMSAGLAANGLVPVFAVYSSFTQRAFDQIHHDVAIGNHHVVQAIDRAGLVGEDGETHQGLYDLSLLRHIPNMTILAPSDYTEFRNMLDFAVNKYKGPIAIRYSKGRGLELLAEENAADISLGKSVVLQDGHDITIIAAGSMVEEALETAKILKEQKGISSTVINARFVKPLDEELINKYAKLTGRVVSLEDNTVVGGFGSGISELFTKLKLDIPHLIIGFEDKFIEHGSRTDIMFKYNLTPAGIADRTWRYFFE